MATNEKIKKDSLLRATFRQFGIRPTDANYKNFRGIRFVLVDLLREMDANETVKVYSDLFSETTVRTAISKVSKTHGFKFTTSKRAGDDCYTITRTC